jgi:hypothetical protein
MGSLAYCSFRLYSDSGLLPVPFDYFILGLGLIGFANIMLKSIDEFEELNKLQDDFKKQGSINFTDGKSIS